MLPLGLVACLLCAPQASLEGELIFPPQPFHNHASSLVETPGGDLLAVWFHGTGERKNDDVQLMGARMTAEDRAAGKAVWSDPFPMADTPDLPDCNPVLFVDPRGTLWLFWMTIQDNLWGGALLKYRTSTDYEGDGPPVWAWQDVVHTRPKRLVERYTAMLDAIRPEMIAALVEREPDLPGEIEATRAALNVKLTRRLGWMTRIHPIMISDTRMMLGLYSDVFNCGLAAFTEDWGKTWQCSEPILDPDATNIGNVQPSFVVKKNGDIDAYMRDNGMVNWIPVSTSKDGGMTWSPLTRREIRNPGSSVEVLPLKSGNWILVCNDLERGRHRLSVYLSEDEGATWPVSRALEDAPEGGGSFSYPSVIQAKDGRIHCTYSWREQGTEGSAIKHVAFDEGWVKAGE